MEASLNSLEERIERLEDLEAIRRLGRGLRATATSPDGMVESIERTDRRFALGLQWHPERDPGRGLPGAGPLQHAARVVVAVLLHPGQVSVAGAGAGERRVPGLRGEDLLVDRVRGHHGFPFGPLGVADPDGDRAAEGPAVPDAAGQLDLVLLELHPRAAAVAGPPPGQGGGDIRRGDLDSGGHALADGQEGTAV